MSRHPNTQTAPFLLLPICDILRGTQSYDLVEKHRLCDTQAYNTLMVRSRLARTACGTAKRAPEV